MSIIRNAALAAAGVMFTLLLVAGCQNGSNQGPITPDSPGSVVTGLTGATGTQGQSAKTNSHAAWGLWDIRIDPETLEVEIVPLRGLEWHANVVEFMQPPHPISNLGIVVDEGASDVPNGLFAVDVTLRHPFPTLHQFRGFDVRGVFLADGSYSSEHDPAATFADPDPGANEARLLNADGYVRWFNPKEFTLGGVSILEYIPAKLGTTSMVSASLNPYKYFSDDFLSSSTKELPLQEVDINFMNRGTFSPTSNVTRRYIIQFEMSGATPNFKFTYVVDASYAEPDEGDPGYPIESFPPDANMQEAYKIACRDNGGTAYFEDPGNFGGNLRFELEIFDWQASVNSAGVTEEIGAILIESPTLLDNYGGVLDLTDTFSLNAGPATETSSVAVIEILDVTPGNTEDQVIFFTVKSADPVDYNNPWGSPYPIEPELAAYYMWYVPVGDAPLNVPPYVGQVVGPETVDMSMPPQNYYADSVYDPDIDQTLSALWSVVPTTNSPVYNIPSNPDLSVDIDWNDYTPDQAYDVNIQVHDGYAYVEGTLLTVYFASVNTPPTVGAVSGPTPVTVANTSASYTAPIVDPDAWQTLTVTWSVVDTGQPANYNIPAETDDSLDQDWSTYDVGFYDVNVEVDDGVAPPVEGTLLTVDLQNTAPTLGVITGDASVDETDTNSVYDHGALTDPDNNQTHTYMWSVVANGDPANYSISPNAASDGLEINWCTYPLGEYDIQVRVSDGIDTGESAVFDVVRGLSSCTGDAHEWYDDSNNWPTFSYLDYTPDGWTDPDLIVQDSYMLPRMDMDFWTRGDFAGEGVMHTGNAVLMNFVADATSGIDDPATSYEWRIPGMSFYDDNWVDAIPCSPRVVLSIDTSPDLNDSDSYDDNRIVIVTSHDHDLIYVLDADETTPTLAAQLMVTLNDVSGCDEISGIAIDEDDDIWALVLGSDTNYRLYHWSYILDDDTGGPYYTFVNGDTINLTTQLGAETDVFDMVVAFTNNHLYILEAGGGTNRGTIHEINLDNSPPTYDGSQGNVFNSSLDVTMVYHYLVWNGSDSDVHNHPYGSDIVIDHNGFENCEAEHCRLEVMGTLSTGATQMVRFDLDLTTLDSNNGGSATEFFICAGLSSDSDVGDRIMVTPPYVINDGAGSDYDIYWWPPPASW